MTEPEEILLFYGKNNNYCISRSTLENMDRDELIDLFVEVCHDLAERTKDYAQIVQSDLNEELNPIIEDFRCDNWHPPI